jgi:hypothetical protein
MFKKKNVIFYVKSPDNMIYGTITNVQYKGGHRIITVKWEDGGENIFREDYMKDCIRFTKKFPKSKYGLMELLESEKAALAHKIKYRFKM